MKHLYLSLIALLCSITAMAVPAERVRKQVELTDGTTIMVTLYGDEHFSWLQTDDGMLVEEAEDGIHYVLTQNNAAEHVASMMNQAQAAPSHAPQRIGSQATAPLPSMGSPKIPVVLVSFTDSVFHVADTDEGVRQYYDKYCNGTRDGNLYQEHGSYGSIRDYFSDQSYGKFTPEFVIIGPVQLDHPESYYGSNGSSKDTRYDEFCSEAVRKATTIYDGDWMNFDNRGKQQVDMVFFIFAGCGEANGGAATTLWPKEKTSSMTYNGIKFATSACCNEMRGRRNASGVVYDTRPDGIGIMCHELSHALGLPDFYNTNYKSFGMDLWSLMDYGCYGSNGYVPCAYTAYERDFMGGQTLEELTQTQLGLTINPISDGGKGYKIVNDENSNEYYVIENRQAVGWDRSICTKGHGLQVTHVDYSASAWNGNSVNRVVDHQRMTIIAANNLYKGTYDSSSTMAELNETWAGNLYPFGENNSLTSTTTPAATVYTAAGFMKKDLLNIVENEDKTVSLDFSIAEGTGIVAAPTASDSKTLFDLQGRRVDNAQLHRGIYLFKGGKLLIP